MSQHGRLLPSDEGLNHQIAETFATVAQSDRSWTEKIWASVFKLDGSLQVDFGLGKYHNRNVMDAFGGVSRGVEQWTVRSSRELVGDPEGLSVGPLHYEVVEPLKSVRLQLDENDVAPVAFDITTDGALPPFMEDRDRKRDRRGFRVFSDTLRYHQPSRVTGWVSVEGESYTLDKSDWMGFRDHSWGVRMDVGQPPPDLRPRRALDQIPYMMLWSPMLFEGDAGPYEWHHYLQASGDRVVYSSAALHRPDDPSLDVIGIEPSLTFDPKNRRLLGGELRLETQEGYRDLTIEPLGDTGFHLGPGGYLGFEDAKHGSWRGEYHLEGEHIADCSHRDTVRRIHQLRDCVVRVHDGDNIGYGVYETIVTGGWPDLGLEGETSFL